MSGEIPENGGSWGNHGRRRLNQKIVVLNGMQRGGTNIVWNLLQSHPDIISPVKETGQTIFPRWTERGRAGKLTRAGLRLAIRAGLPGVLARVDSALYRGRVSTLDHEDNRYKSPEEIYREDELEDLILVTKSIGADVVITPALARFFPWTRAISVVRNGLAVAEGWIRRGSSPERAAAAYVRFSNEVARQQRVLKKHLIVRFEDCVDDPIGQLGNMCRFLGVDSEAVRGIRLKAKSVMGPTGSHGTAFGEEGRKVWIETSQVRNYLDPTVSDNQIRRLQPDVRRRVIAIAGHSMRQFGYEL